MDGVFFLLSVVAVGLLMRWLVANDAAAADQPTSGLFALVKDAGPRRRRQRGWMSEPEPKPEPEPKAAAAPPRLMR